MVVDGGTNPEQNKESYSQPDMVVVMTPMHRTLEAVTAFCIEKAHAVGLPFVWSPHPGDALIGRARSIQATWFLEKFPYDHAIFLDSDIVFEPENLAKLILNLKEGHDLIGGVYVVRHAQQLAHYNTGGKTIIDGSIKPITYLSTGFMGFSKKLLQKMVDELDMPILHEKFTPFRCYPFFESGRWWHEEDKQWIYVSEDWDFCDKAKKVDIQAELDTSILLGHQGNHVFTLDQLPANVMQKIDSPDSKPKPKPTIHLPTSESLNRTQRRQQERELLKVRG